MANKLVYSWADKLRQINPPRKYIATRWQLYKIQKTMNGIKTLTVFTIFFFLTLVSIESNSQTFEGKIIYRISVELPENSNISIEHFEMMFQDMDTIANFYLKNSNYKMVTLDAKTNKPKT